MNTFLPPDTDTDFPHLRPPRCAIPDLSLPKDLDRSAINPTKIVQMWLSALSQSIQNHDCTSFVALFVDESWWRDLVALTWDTRSLHGPRAISEYVLRSTATLNNLAIIDAPNLRPSLEGAGPASYVQAAFSLATKYGTGRGIVRLVQVSSMQWKAWTVSTQLERLNEVDAPVFNGTVNGTAAASDELQVLVVGAGQAGVGITAHLEDLGLRYLLIEKHPRVGDCWRNRYDSLKTHTPSYGDHFPFLRYPSNWPKNVTKDQMGNWIDSYSQIMGLKVWTSTTIANIDRTGEGKQARYTVELDRDGTRHTLIAKHIVLATGLTGQKPNPIVFPCADTFRGLRYHSIDHKSASEVPDLQNMKVTIIGTGTSAHDIAKDYVDHGAKQVCMIQRNYNIFITLESLEDYFLAFWKTPDLKMEDGDLIELSLPLPLLLTLASQANQLAMAADKELLDGIEKAGMALRRGQDGISLMDYLVLKGGHYYLDQGAGQMIIDGRIRIHQCKEGIKSIYESGVEVADGTKIDSDVIVQATGYEGGGAVVERIFGKDVAEKANSKYWGALDEEMERKGWWRATGMAGLWFQTGPFAWARQGALQLALQILGIEQGLNDAYYTANQ